MNVSRKISTDIMKYLQGKKGMSIDDIAKAMSTSITHIQEVINKKDTLKSEDINVYLKNQKIRFWEFVKEAIPDDHLPPSLKKKLKICKELSDHLKKVKKTT